MEQGQDGERILAGLRIPTSTTDRKGRGIYDDFLFVMNRSSDGSTNVPTFMFNTDPSGVYDPRSLKVLVPNKNGKGSTSVLEYLDKIVDADPKVQAALRKGFEDAWQSVETATDKKTHQPKTEGRDVNGDGLKDLGALQEGTYYFEPLGHDFAGNKAWISSDDEYFDRITALNGGYPTYAEGDVGPAGKSGLFHQGGERDTGSAGCQTIKKSDYQRFINAVGGADKSFYYVLVNTAVPKKGGR